MERGPSPKILRLEPESEFVSFLHLYFSVFLPFLRGLQRLNRVLIAQFVRAKRAHYTWGLLIQKLNIIILRALWPPHMCHSSICTFFCHYMHQYDLRFGHAGLPSSCVYALRSR